MIITSEKKDVQVGGDFQTQQFSILASAKAFDILTSKIYTNKVKAVIREISTNAWDSHQDAGNPDPFDVHLPTSLEPWFSVRDYGTGISPEQMMTLYTEFFRSTRTESKVQVFHQNK
jgi:DNA topoisomerase VI subunit B